MTIYWAFDEGPSFACFPRLLFCLPRVHPTQLGTGYIIRRFAIAINSS